MKYLIITACLLLAFTGYGQNFAYNEVITQGQSIKMKGKVTVSDTLINIYTNNVPAGFNVNKILDVNQTQTFEVVNPGTAKIRITVTNTATNKTLLLETKDEFSGVSSSLVYLLKLD